MPGPIATPKWDPLREPHILTPGVQPLIESHPQCLFLPRKPWRIWTRTRMVTSKWTSTLVSGTWIPSQGCLSPPESRWQSNALPPVREQRPSEVSRGTAWVYKCIHQTFLEHLMYQVPKEFITVYQAQQIFIKHLLWVRPRKHSSSAFCVLDWKKKLSSTYCVPGPGHLLSTYYM